jgi:tRNA threonylcarbamoyladenosine biosynthesis protein TsaE
LARFLRPGDLVVLNGGLGAGKTTLVQGIGQGLEVRGEVTSPTFIIARVHPALSQGPALIHVDAYRLEGLEQLDDLDLEASLETSVTVVEWGKGLAERLSDDHLEIILERPRGACAGNARLAVMTASGQTWLDRWPSLTGALSAAPEAT